MPILSTRSGLSAEAFGFASQTNTVVGQQIYTPSTSGGTTVTTTGQQQFTFTVPVGVTSISVLCVGAGGFGIGGNGTGCGGGGGALAYTNNYFVIPGQTYTVLVGSGGSVNQSASLGSLSSSRDSTFGSTICGAGGGQTNAVASANIGGTVLYGSGGSGGGSPTCTSIFSAGGGGAGGYSGDGGRGGSNNEAGVSGTGGGAGGGSGTSGSAGGGGFGGGAGIYGLGSNGLGGALPRYCGTGGSGGNPLTQVQSYITPTNVYGGGGGGIRFNDGEFSDGGPGVVRIVWPGVSRQFPSTNVDNF